MGAVVQTAMVSAIGSARYTPVTASGQRCGSEQLIAFVHKITYVHYRADPRRAEDRGQFMSYS